MILFLIGVVIPLEENHFHPKAKRKGIILQSRGRSKIKSCSKCTKTIKRSFRVTFIRFINFYKKKNPNKARKIFQSKNK